MEDDDDEVEDVTANHQPVRVMPRGGGKNLLRMAVPDQDEDDDDEEEEESEEDEKNNVTYQVVPRGGGKSLTRMVPREDESDDESEHEELEEDEIQPFRSLQPASGGKGLFNRGGGKMLRPPSEEEPVLRKEPENVSVNQVSSDPRGEQLQQPVPVLNEPASMAESSVIEPSLKQPEPKKLSTSQISTAISRGKQLRKPETKQTKEPAEKKAPVKIVASPGARGKQLRKPIKEDEEEDDYEDEMELESDSSENELEVDEDDEDFAVVVPKSRPKRKAAAKKPIVDDDDIGEDEVSSDGEDEMELDINNTEALIRDEADRKHLDSLPELEREAILAERFEKLKAEQDMKKAIREARYVLLSRVFHCLDVVHDSISLSLDARKQNRPLPKKEKRPHASAKQHHQRNPLRSPRMTAMKSWQRAWLDAANLLEIVTKLVQRARKPLLSLR